MVHAAEDASADLARGRHIGESVAQCTFCHAADWGGRRVSDDAWVGRLYAPNLTSGRGGIAPQRSDEDLARAIRHAQNPEGRNLWLMPSEWYVALSDRDLASLIRYMRTLPPVDRESPARIAGPLTKLVTVLGLAPDVAIRGPRVRPWREDGSSEMEARDHGDYLVNVGVCGTCHRSDLAGGRHPLAPLDEPIPGDISPGSAVARWSEEEFIETMRTGTTPDGRRLDPVFMPWPSYAGMTDPELSAIHRRLIDGPEAASSLPAVAAPPPL